MTSLIERLRNTYMVYIRQGSETVCDDRLTEEAATAIESLTKELEELRETAGMDSISTDAIHVIRQLLEAHDVPVAAFVDDHVGNAIFQRDKAREEVSTLTRDNKALRDLLQRAHRYVENEYWKHDPYTSEKADNLRTDIIAALSSPPPSPSQERDRVIEECAKAAEVEPGTHEECAHLPEYFDGRQDAAYVIRRLKSAGLTKRED